MYNSPTTKLLKLVPRQGSPGSYLQAMKRAQERHSYVEFERHMLSFLKYLHDGLTKPDLVQVEEGRITVHGTEIPESESREMIRRMGL